MKALHLHITGIVQGVGFRPFVYRLAVEHGLMGWVLNASDGVYVLVEGDPFAVDAFPALVRDRAPAMAVIDDIVAEEVEPEGFTDFEIRASRAEQGAMTLVSPDIATCPECLAELVAEGDRRFHYPFINCTNCGPRFTIIEDVPYDRPMTTMRDFPMCEECAAEYGDPADRRFHAQPDACFICGPRLYLNPANGEAAGAPARSHCPPSGFRFEAGWMWTRASEPMPRPHRDRVAELRRSEAIVRAATELLRAGCIVAVKGLGGFQLACDATNEEAVQRLRARKNRWGKPLAVMVPTLEAARELGEVGPEEEALLTGSVRPIVLLRRRGGAGTLGSVGAGGLAWGVAERLAEVGVMLPYTPLHHLLLRHVDRPLVMTSGNLSEEPIVTGNAEALERLGRIADAFLMHDRDIYSRYDDSVVRVVEGRIELVRRARGYAPFPLHLSFKTDLDILAVGTEQKNTFTLLTDGYAFVSQHIGDLENAETLESFERTLELYERLFRIDPKIVAYDLHPEYLATKWALALDLPRIGVQHHHAHIVSVTAEHGVDEPVIGVAFDGTGYGTDGHIWGGEVLLGDWAGFERFAHLAEVPLVGGEAAIRRPARMAVATLDTFGLLDHPGASPLRKRLAEGEEALLLRMIERGVNSPPTSSMGRLFDAVASIAGVADDARYEGEAAILLEACADLSAEGAYEFALRTSEGPGDSGGDRAPGGRGIAPGGSALVIDPAPVLSAALDDFAAGVPSAVVAMRFHRAVAAGIVAVASAAAKATGVTHVALAGGVFMNRIVLGTAMRRLASAGLTPLTHVKLPMNDGAVSFGQAVSAWARRHEI